MENEEKTTLDFGSIDFTPAWARKDAGVTVGRAVRDAAEKGDDRPDARRGFRDASRPAPRGGGMQGQRDFRKQPQGARRERAPRETAERFRGEIRVLPEPKALGTIIRKLQQDSHAYKLKDLAYFLLDNPSSVLLRITPAKDETAKRFFQCRACGFAATDEAEIAAHACQAHLADYYDAVEEDCEPPKGDFPCVAKCGVTGVLLGPPNFHGFASAIRETMRRNSIKMSEQEYRSRIVMVHDKEAVEEWRAKAVKKTSYVAKGAGEGAAKLTREQAEGEFRRTMAPSLVDSPKVLAIPADAAASSQIPGLRRAAAEAIENERRSPAGMCFALRGAFHHRKMHFFRANDARGQEFATGVELKEFDSAHAIPELAKVAEFVAEHPCASYAEIAPDDETRKRLDWLVSTGHVVAFTNGVYSKVEKYPKYGPHWRKTWAAGAKPAESNAGDAKPSESAPEAVAEPPEANVEAPAVNVETPAVDTEEKKEEPKNETSDQLAE